MSDLNYLYGIARYHLGLTSKEGKAVIEAADEIERQRKLISELNQHYGGQADEIERLRDALEEIVNHPEATNYESPSYYHGRDELQEIAREALKDDS